MMNKTVHTMRFKNVSEHVLNLTAIGWSEPVEPGEEIDIPLYLCAPGRGDGGQRTPSSLESVAPQMKPVDPEEAKLWAKVPPPPVPESKIVTITNNKPPGEPIGVKALRESLAAKKAQEAPGKPVEAKKVGA